MKILYFISGAKNGYGGERVAVEIIKQLSEQSIDFYVVTAYKGFVYDYCKENSIPCLNVFFYSFMRRNTNNIVVDKIRGLLQIIYGFFVDFIAFVRILLFVKIDDIDLIYSNWSRSLIGEVISKIYNKKHICHLHELYSGHYNIRPLFHNQIKWINNNTCLFIAVSAAVRDNWSKNGLDENKIRVVYNGINVESFERRKKTDDITFRMVMVASINKSKGQYYLIRAIGNIPVDVRRKIIVHFYGEENEKGEIKKIISYAKHKEINVSFMGYCNSIYSILKNYDIGISCSKGEAFGLSIVEYMAAGLLTIAPNECGCKEIISNGVTGYLFNDISELTQLLLEIINDYNSNSKLIDAAISDVKERFDSLDYSSRLMNAFMSSSIKDLFLEESE